MDDEIKTGEMTGEIDESITVEEDFTLLEGKAVSINDDSDNKTKEEEVYEEALDVKESLDDIRQQIKDKLLNILEKGKITDADSCEIELLNDQYNEKYNELKDLANTVIPGGKGTSIENASTTDNSTTEIVKINIDYDEILNAINEKADWLYIDEDGQVMLNGEVVPKLKVVELEAEKIKADVGEFKELTAESFTATNARIENLAANKADIEYLTANYATIEKLNATNAEITNLKSDYGEFKNLTAGNFTAINADIDNLTANKADVDYLTSNYATINMLNTNVASINTALIDKANVSDLNATNALVEDLRASKADIADLTAVNAKITNLEAGKADIAVLEANYATIKQLDATNANVTNLQTETANINKALINKANVIDLNATNAKVTDLQATKANVSDLNAAKANISSLTSDLADITTLVNGNLTSDNIQSMVITGDKFTVADGFIKNAMIDSVNANKINAGSINTNKVTIQSNDGSMVLKGNLQQFKDKNGKVRIQIGKDTSGNFTFVLYDENGTGQLINQNGIQSSDAIADGLIVDAKVADNANIAGSKLDIDSVVTEVNNGSTSIKGTKIYLDDQSQSLDVAFNNMTTTVNGNTSTLNSHTTSINTMNGKITQLISDTTITKQDGTTTSLKDAYNATVDTVNSHTQTIGSLETNLNKVSTGQNKWLLEMFEKGDGIDDISPITIKDTIGKPLRRAILVDDSVTSNQSQFGNQYLGRATTYVYLDEDYNWETTATSDDGSTIYINGVAIATLGTCTPTAVTVPFKQGWNKITWVYNEGIGGDGWDFNPRLTTLPQVKYMNAYPMTNTDEVGNVLDSNIKTVSSKQATLEQNLDGFKQTVSNTYTTKADFDNLNVGGRNFIINSGFKGVVPDTATFPHWSHWGDVKVFHEQGNTNYNAINTLYLQNHTATGGGIYQDISSAKIPKNTQITVSYDMSREGNVKGSSTALEFYDADLNRLDTIVVADAVGHVVRTITTPNIDYSVMRFVIGHHGSNSNAGGYLVRIGNVKIEKGNKATDWTPAPEDIDNSITAVDSKFVNYSTTNQMNSAINQKANEITSTVSETYATKASLTTVDNKFANYSTTSAMNSAINQKANEITSTVSETYATKTSVSDLSNNLTNNYSTTSAMNSAINQKANEITSTVSETYATKTALNTVDGKFANYSTTSDMNSAINQRSDSILSTVSSTYATKAEFDNLSIGGRNLVKNSNFAKGSLHWGTIHSASDTILHNGHKSLRISMSGADNYTWSGASQTVLNDIQPNTTITMSCWYYIEDKSTFDNNFGFELKGDRDGSEHQVLMGTGIDPSQMENGVWKRLVGTATTNCHWNSLYIFPWVAKNGTVYVTDIKVELGNKATDWTPAPEDINASITAVDNKLVNYATINQMNSSIDQKANEINLNVSNNYATKTSVTDLNNNLSNNYSTTQQMNSAIDIAKSSIKLDVSNNYASKHEVAHYFEGENKWKLDLYSLGSMSGASTPTKELIVQSNCQYQSSMLVEHPSYLNDYTNNYVGYATTYMHFTEAHQWNGQVATDDAGSVYLNDEFVLSTTSCQFKDITLNFRAGWNKLEVLYAEGGGGDGWQFNPEIAPMVGGVLNKMNCYGQNSTEEYIKANYSTTEQMNSAINIAKDSITSTVSQTYSTKAETDNKINNVKIGGTNLFRGTANLDSPYWIGENAFLTDSYYRGSRIYRVSYAWADYNYPVSYLFEDDVIELNTEYTFSCYARTNNGDYRPNLGIYGDSAHMEGNGLYIGTVGTEWRQYSGIIKFYDGNRDYVLRIEPTTESGDNNKYIEVCGLKLEKGNKATDWSPAPADIDASIEAVDNKFVNYSTIQQMNSAIDQKANEINLNVSNTYATKTSVNDLNNNLINNYSTTQQMNSAIDIAKSGIKLDVSQNYASKHEVAHYFEGENKWKLDIYSLGTMAGSARPTKESMAQSKCQYQRSVLVAQPSYSGDNYGNNYVGYATTHMYFTTAYQWTGRVITDDNGTVYLNDVLVSNVTTCQWADITLNFKAGWNKIEVLYAEGSGGDGWQFDPEIKVGTGDKLTKMNCYGQNSTETYLKENYSTTQQMNTAINQKADSITQSVSSTYATKTDLNTANGNISSLTNRMQSAESKLTKDSLTTTIGSYYTTSTNVNDLITAKGYATTSQLQQTATDLTATFNDGYNQGITRINKDGIKVLHNSIDSNSYTHMAPAGFYIKNKGTDIFKVDANGLYVKGNGEFTGKITSTSGAIGGYTISDYIIKGTNVGMSSLSGHDWAFWAGASTGGSAPFRVGHDGSLTATQATITGTITGSIINGGVINGSTINSDSFVGDVLAIDGTISAKSLQVQDIDNARYPATLDGDIELYVNNSTGNDDNEPDDDVRFKTLQGAIDAIPKFLNGKTVYITMETDSTEDVYMRGFVGGAIRIYMNGKTLYGTLRSYVCAASINVYGGSKSSTEGATGTIHPNVGLSFGTRAVSVGFEASQYAALYKIKVYAPDNIPSDVSNTDKVCVASQAGTGSVYCKNIQIVNAVIGFRTNNHGSMHVNSSSGVASKYGFQAVTGGIISMANNNQAGGKTANTNKNSGGQVWCDSNGPKFATGNQTTDGGTAPVAPTTKTLTIKSSYGDTYRSTVYNSWKRDGSVRGGDYGYGDCNGCWFFGSAFSEVKGKTISKVEITITRNSGGKSSAVGLVVKSHGYSGRPSGAPTYRTTAGTLSLATGATGKLTITNSTILNEISSGTVKGFGIQNTYDSNNYAVCSGSCTVKITYTE